MKHIASKLYAGFLCMAGVTIALIWLLQAGIMKDNYLNARVATIDAALQQALGESSLDYAELESHLNSRLVMVDANGNVIYSSQNMPMKGMMMGMMMGMQGISTLPADGTVQTFTSAMGETSYAALGRTGANGSRLYAVFSLADVEKASQILRDQMWIITVVLFVAASVLAVLLSRLFSRPVRKITWVARALAEGKYGITIDVKSADEIGQLATSLNELGGQLEKTEALRRELIANVSHELRSPLAVIQGYAETVRDVTWPNEQKRQEQLTVVAEEAARLSRVVEDILDYSKLQAGVTAVQFEDLALPPALEQIIRVHEMESVPKRLKLSLHCEELRIRFDPGKLSQVMGNLIHNAINHADADTEIVIEAKCNGAACRISVTNTGETIAPDELPHIWERYYRAHSIGEGRRLGTGLGLAIVKTILDQHGSTYGVESAQHRTTFWFEAQALR